MEALVDRFFGNLIGRLEGPMQFRLILQPLMAIIWATIDGLKDAKAGRPAYFWAVVNNQGHRGELLRNGWKHFGKVFILAIVLDVIYQLKVEHTVYPGEVLLVALILAVLPYVLLRGPINRFARRFERGTTEAHE